jgi:hypothetical protein
VASQGALKLNFDKKVSFGDQLSFGFKQEPQMFAAEMPAALEFKGNAKVAAPEKNPGAKGSLKKKAPNKKMGFFEGHIQALLEKKKGTPNQGPKSAKKKEAAGAQKADKGDFNLDTRPSKYFDPDIDPKSKREYLRDNQLRAQALEQRKNAGNP